MSDDDQNNLGRQIECVKREIRMRQSVYPSRVANGKMTAKQAQNEIDAMRAVLHTLELLQDDGK